MPDIKMGYSAFVSNEAIQGLWEVDKNNRST